MWLSVVVLAATAATSDLRAVLPEQDLQTMLRSRGESCDGCSRDDLIARVQATDDIARDLAQKGSLEIAVRYCAS